MVEAVPFEEHLAGGDVDLLGGAGQDRPLGRPAQRREVGGHLAVRGDQGGALRGELEIVQVRLGPVARLDGGDDPVGAVGDVGRPGGDADLVHHARRPGEHRLAAVLLRGEVQGCPAEGRPEPDQAAVPVHDHQAGLPYRCGRVAPGGDEDVRGLAGPAGRLRHRDGRRPNIAPGHEVIDVGGGTGGRLAGGRVAGGRVTGCRGRVIGGCRVRPRIADVTGQPQPGDAGRRRPAAPECLSPRPVWTHDAASPPHPRSGRIAGSSTYLASPPRKANSSTSISLLA